MVSIRQQYSWLCLLLGTAATAAAAAAAAKQQATCRLSIQGYGGTKVGIAIADVACTTSDGSPLVVGVSSTYMPNWSRQFSPQWTGVTIQTDLQCNTKPDSNPTAENQVDGGPMHALLYFCGDYQLQLNQPVIQGLRLQSSEIQSSTSGSTDAPSSGLGSVGSNVGSIGSGAAVSSPSESQGNGNFDAAVNSLLGSAGTSSSPDTTSSGPPTSNSGISSSSNPLDTASSNLLSDSGVGGRGLLARALTAPDQSTSSGEGSNIGQPGTAIADSSGLGSDTFGSGVSPSTSVGSSGGLGGVLPDPAGLHSGGNSLSSDTATGAGGSSSSPGSAGSGRVNLDTAISSILGDTSLSGNIGSALSSSDITLGPPAAVLLIGGGVIASITGGVFTDNKAAGSMLWVDGRGATADTFVTVSHSTFADIAADRGAAVKASHRAQVVMDSCKCVSNSVRMSGGAIEAKGVKTHVVVYNSSFVNNSAMLFAGAISGGFFARVDISGSTFFDNSAYQVGTVYSEYAGIVTVSNSTVANNAAGLGGGLGCYEGNLTVGNNTKILNNFALAGGGVFLADCQANITNSTVSNNACNISAGGGIDFRGSCTLRVSDSVISNNMASLAFASAGGIFGSLFATQLSDVNDFQFWKHPTMITLSDSNSGSFLLSNSVISGNEGTVGGCSIPHNYTVSILNSKFLSNMGNATGGMTSSGNVTIVGGMLSNNTGPYGGALAADAGSLTVTGSCSITNNTATMDGGALYASNSLNVSILGGASVSNNTARRNGGGVLVSENAHMLLDHSTLSGNTASGDNALRVALGGGLMLSDHATADVVGSNVTSNAAQSGGGIYAMGASVLSIKGNSSITGNIALSGGGIAVEGAQLITQQPAVVTQNLAQVQAGGAMLDTDKFDPSYVSQVVFDNSAPFHMNVGVTPTNISLSALSPNHGGRVSELTDDGVIPLLVNITGVHGVPCDGEALSAVVTSIPAGHNFTIVNISQSDGGTWLNLPLPPGSYAVEVSHKFNHSVPTAKLNLELQSCNPGQVLSVSTGSCQLCPQGAVSLSPDSSSGCEQCPVGAQCPGGAVLLVQPGFWRSSALSNEVHRCANPSACGQPTTLSHMACSNTTKTCGTPDLGNLDTRDFKTVQCTAGYEGNLCGVCATGCGTNKPFSCRKCLSHSAIVGLLVLAAICLLLMIKGLCHFTVRGTLQNGRGSRILVETCPTTTADPDAVDPPVVPKKLQPTDLLKTLVLYMQYMLIIASLNIQWPESILYPFQALAWLFSSASPETLSVDCLFARGDALPFAIKKTLFYLAMPLLMLCVLLLYEGVVCCVVAKRITEGGGMQTAGAYNLFDRLLSCAVVVLFFFLPSLARTTFSLFACVLLDYPPASSTATASSTNMYAALGSFWMLDMDQQCYHGYHKAWSLALGMPLLLLLCIALPAAVLGLTLHSRRRMRQDPDYVCHYGFLSEPYKQPLCFWEGVIALQTEGLVAISVFGFTLGPYYQTLVMHTAIASVLLLLIVYKPHAKVEAGIVMQRGVFCLLVTSLAALSFMPNGYIQPTPLYGLIMGALLVVFNMLFVVSVIVQIAVLLEWSNLWGKVVGGATTAKQVVFKVAIIVKKTTALFVGVSHKPKKKADAASKDTDTGNGVSV